MKIQKSVAKYTWDSDLFCLCTEYVDISAELSPTEAKQKVKWHLKCYALAWLSLAIFIAGIFLAAFVNLYFLLGGVVLCGATLLTYIGLPCSWKNEEKYKDWRDSTINKTTEYLDLVAHNSVEIAKKNVWEEENSLTVSVHNYCCRHNIRDLVDIMDYLKKEGVIQK